MHQGSSVTHPMFGKDIRRCCALTWLEASGTDFFSERFEEKLFHVVFVEVLMGTVFFFLIVLYFLWLRFVKS